jgi:ABC-type multidrug transport system ATPase subunit
MALSSKHLTNFQAVLNLLLHIAIFVRVATKGAAMQHTASGGGEDERRRRILPVSFSGTPKNHHGNDASIRMLSANDTTRDYNASTGLSDHDVNLLQNNKKCLSKERLSNIYLYYGLASPTAKGPRVSVFDNERIFRSIVLFENNFTARYKGSGVFVGVESVVEYMSLGNGDLNGGYSDVVMNSINDVTCVDDDSMYVNATSTIKIIGWSSDGLSESTNNDYHTFAPNRSPLLVQVDTIVPQELLEGAISTHTSISRQALCDTAVLRCPGELYPYRNLQECYDKMATMHTVCEDGANDIDYTGGAFQGDTVTCRFLHLLSSGLRPLYHCPHMKDISEKCRPEHCLGASERLKVPVEVNKYFDAGYSSWILFVELALLSTVMMIVFFSFNKFRTARRASTFEIYDSTGLLADGDTCNEDNHLQSKDNENQFPCLAFQDLQLSWTKGRDVASNSVLLDIKENYLGGCQLTAITAPSGTGKTTLMRLFCGFEETHMQLSVGKWLKMDPVSYCPHHADMFPREMTVRDIISFACNLANVDPNDYRDCFQILGINDLINQTIGSLSGGQLQRVNICQAVVVRPTPSVVFLDEPLGALDTENALHCLTALKKLPVKHSFVMSVHDPSPNIRLMFDRIVHLDCKHRKTFVDTTSKMIGKDLNVLVFSDIDVDDDDNNKTKNAHFRGSIKASFILWFGQFYGMPYVEAVLCLCTIVGALFTGLLARKSTAEWSDYLPTSEGVRFPFYMADILVAMSLISSFGGSLIYGWRERDIINHFVTIKAMDPFAYLLTSFAIRCIVHGIIQAGLWVFIFLPMLELPLDNSLMVFVTCAMFGFSWAGLTFAVAFICPRAYTAHTLMVLDMFAAFNSGVFFIWSSLYQVLKVFHYANPLFYTLSAISYMVLNSVDTGCSDTQHPGECASGTRLLELADVVQCSGLRAQGVSIIFGVAAFVLSLYKLRSKLTTSRRLLRGDPKI